MANPTCTIDECEKPARSKSAALCPMHYHRQYRHGDVTKSAFTTEVTASKGRRYQVVYAPGHPVAGVRGMAYAHRIALHDSIGPGEHPCHWCGCLVSWDWPRSHPAALQVDHLNDLGDDNAPSNLAPACRRCNPGRGAQRRSDALRAAGWWSGHDTVGALGTRRTRVEGPMAVRGNGSGAVPTR